MVEEYKIDFVVPWVDGSDINWREEKKKYSPKAENDDAECRYRDIELIKYMLRSVEKYAPWVNKVHFITWGHLPSWLNTECPKLNIVKHSDYFPEIYLPTFCSHPIELNLHRIKGLSEQFVYFNDDMLLNAPLKKEFFFKKGKPRDFACLTELYIEDSDDCYGHICLNDTVFTNKEIFYSESFFKNPFKYINVKYGIKNNLKNIFRVFSGRCFTGFKIHHMPAAYLKKTLERVWEIHKETLERVSKTKFRSPYDVSQSLFRNSQLAKGDFVPMKPEEKGRYLKLEKDTGEIIKTIKDERVKMLCINDIGAELDFESAKTEIISALEEKFPEKSSFEK